MERVDERGALEDRARLVVPPLHLQNVAQPQQRVAHVWVLREHLAQRPLRAGGVRRVTRHEHETLGRPGTQQPWLQLQRAFDRPPCAIHFFLSAAERLG